MGYRLPVPGFRQSPPDESPADDEVHVPGALALRGRPFRGSGKQVAAAITASDGSFSLDDLLESPEHLVPEQIVQPAVLDVTDGDRHAREDVTVRIDMDALPGGLAGKELGAIMFSLVDVAQRVGSD